MLMWSDITPEGMQETCRRHAGVCSSDTGSTMSRNFSNAKRQNNNNMNNKKIKRTNLPIYTSLTTTHAVESDNKAIRDDRPQLAMTHM